MYITYIYMESYGFDAALEFEWDYGNSEKNRLKHGVERNECEEVFFNEPLIVGADLRHSQREERFFLLGTSDGGRLLFIVFTRRNKKIRVISARDMSRKELIEYEKLKRNT